MFKNISILALICLSIFTLNAQCTLNVSDIINPSSCYASDGSFKIVSVNAGCNRQINVYKNNVLISQGYGSLDVSGLNAGDYEVLSPATCGCATSSSKIVTLFSGNPTVLIPYVNTGSGSYQADKVYACRGSNVDLGVQPLGWAGLSIAGPNGFADNTPDGSSYWTLKKVQPNQSGTYVITFRNSYGCVSTRNIVLTVGTLSVNAGSDSEACIGTAHTLNATASGQAVCQNTCPSTLDSLLVVWDLDQCNASNQTQQNSYAEFTPSYPSNGNCTQVSASNMYRDLGEHSCTPVLGSYGGDVGVCVPAMDSCDPADYNPSHAIKVEVTLTPQEAGRITKLSFREQSPLIWITTNGSTGPNNYNTKYLLRVYKNDLLIYSEDERLTERTWNLEEIDFSTNPAFAITETATFRFELRGYCVTNAGGNMSGWEINDIRIFGGCCTGLTTYSNISYLWSTGETTSSINVNPSTSSTYFVTVRDCQGCTYSDSVKVNVNQLPTPNINGQSSICIGGTSVLTATGGISYEWSTGETSSAISVTPTTTSAYTVTVTDSKGCKASTNKTLIVNPLPSPVISGDLEICLGQSTTLTVSGGISYEWSTGATTSSITVSPTTNTTYLVMATDGNGCENFTEALVVVNPLPIPTISGNSTICSGETTTLTAGGGVQYLWNTGETTASISVTLTSNTTYTVTVTDEKGCSAIKSKLININSLPIPIISGNTTFCVGASTVLTASGGVTYAWSTGATTSSISINPGLNTIYTVTVTDANGCTASASRMANVNELPTANIVGDDELCKGSSTSLIASGGVLYHWDNGTTANTLNVSPNSTTIYRVTVTDSNGCTGTSAHRVMVHENPSVTISGDNEICIGGNAELSTTVTGTTFCKEDCTDELLVNWTMDQCNSDGVVNQRDYSEFVSTQISNGNFENLICTNVYRDRGDHSCTYDGHGGIGICIGTMESCDPNNYDPINALRFNVTVNPNELGKITKLTFREQSPFMWSTTNGSTGVNNYNEKYLIRVYKNGNLVYSQNNLPTARTWNEESFDFTDHAEFTVEEESIFNFELYGYCVVESGGTPGWEIDDIKIFGGECSSSAVASNVTYLWSTGATTSNINVNPTATTTYTVAVTNCNGCKGTDDFTLTVHPLPTANIAGNNEICLGGHTTLTATGGTSYLWSNGETTNWITVSPSATTEYSVSVTDGNGCQATAAYTVTVHPLPKANIAGDNEICLGGHTTLTATGGTSYIWSNGETTNWITVSPSATTEYSVTVTDSNGCQATAAYTVTVHPLPTANIAGDNEICLGGHTTLTATGGTSYLWSNGETTNWITVSPSATTEYSVTVTDSNGCQATSAYTVTVHPLPTATIAGDNEICLGGHTTLTATGGTSYVWSNGETTTNITVSPSATTEYSVTVTDSNGCQATAAYTVTVHPLPTANIAGDNEICLGGHTTLTTTGGTSYLWSNGETTNWITVSPSATTEYSVTVTDSNGCQATAAYTVTVHPLPTATIAGDNEICLGGHTTLTATGGTSYLWSNGETTNWITVSPSATTEYSVTVTDSNGCQATAAYTVTVHPLPTANIAGDNEICLGGHTTLTATGGTSYLWSNGETTNWITVSPSATTEYSVTVTDGNGCQATAAYTVTVHPLPTATIAGDNEICLGGHTTLTATGGTSYIWSNGETTTSITVSPGATTEYSVTVTDGNGCQATAAYTVTVHSLPTANIAGDNEICLGGHTTLTATGGTSYLWSNGETTTSITVSPSATTEYSVTVTDGNGCQATAVYTVTVHPLPPATIAGDNEICLGGHTTLTATGGTSYVWSNGETTNWITVSPSATTEYSVTVTDSNGCQATAAYTVTVHPLPTANIAGDNEICLGGHTTLTATGGTSYLWSNGETTNWITVSPSATTEYSVTVTDGNGCQATAAYTVTVHPLPTANIAGDNEICLGGHTTLTATGGTSYLWSNGETTNWITVSPSATTEYSVTVTDGNGCQATAAYTVTVHPLPTATIAGDNEICLGGHTTLTATGGTSYIWSNGETTTSITVSPGATTEYNVTVTDGNGCQATAAYTVTVHSLPTANIAGDNEICLGGNTTLTATGGTSYIWSNGETTTSITVSPGATTEYNVTVTDGNGCQATAAYTVTVHSLPEINITGDLEICKGECTDLTASGGIEYEWSNIGSNNYQCNGAFFVGGLQGGATQSLYNISDTQLTEIASLNANNINGIAYYCSPNKVPFIYGMKMKGNTIQDATKANLVQINPINGNLNILGEIPQPPNPYGAAGTTGIMAYIADASSSGKYYFPAVSALVDPFSFSVIDYTVYLGTIDLNNHGNGANVTYRPIGITSTCKPYMDACVNAFQVYAANPVSREPSGGIHDWALNENDGVLYSFFGIENAIFRLNLTTLNTNCSAGPTSNSAFTGQTGVQTDEFGGIYYENGKLMGYQVDRGRNFEINTIDGSLSLVSSNYPRDFRGDNAICKDCGDPTSNPGNTSEVTVCPDTTTTYTVTVTDEFGCKSTKEVTVVVNPLPTPLISGNSAICFGTSTILTVSGAGNYLWSTGETTSSISVSPTTTTTYQVTLTDGRGCKGSSSHTLAINPLPTPTVFGINEICLGSSTTLFATGGTSYVWSNGETTNWITVSPSATTEYSVTVTDSNGCQATAAYTVTVHPLPTATIAGDNEICLGGHTTLTATGGTSYLWSNGETTNWITVSPSATTEYSVTVTDSNGCQATAAYTVTVHPLPTATIAGDNEICLGGHTTLTATGGTSYLWSNGETTNWITVSPSATTEYSVTVTDGHGCQATAAYTVTVHPLPTANIAGDNEICLGGHTTLTATGGTSYVWSNGETTNWITVSPSATTEYSVTVTDGNGCEATATYTVTVHPLPTANIAGDKEICLGGHTTLTATGGTSYVWSNGETTNWITVSPSATTEYSVTVTDGHGCEATATYTVTVHSLPTTNIAGDNEICLGGHTTLTATGGTSYVWSNGETTNWITVSPSATTEYSVTVTDGNGCQATAAYTVTVHPLPTANIAGDNEICLGGHTTLTATGGTSYLWSNGETTNWITVSPSATTEYSVTVTDGHGCEATATYTVTVHPLPTANIAGDNEICLGGHTTLTATGGTSYVWSNGETTNWITVSPSATTEYSVTVTDGHGCQATAAYTVTVHPLPTANIAGDNEICLGGHTTLTATGGTSYVWSNGETTNWITISPSVTTEYSVTVTDGHGCQATAAYTVTVHPLPTANIAGDNEICLGGHTTLTATGGTSFVWSNGETTNWITVSPSATTEYSVTVTDGHGCQATAAYTITVHPQPEITITGDLEICKGECTYLTATGGVEYEWGNIESNRYQCNGSFFVGGFQGGTNQSLYNITNTELVEIGSIGTNNVNGIAYFCQANKTPFIYGMKIKGNTILDATKASLVQINPINGNLTILGDIPQPPNPYGPTGTTGIMAYIADATSDGKYYFPAVSALINPVTFSVIDYTVYLGTIDLNNHGNGANVTYQPIGITTTCRPYMDACVNAFQLYAANPGSREPSGGIQDWAINETEGVLYSFFGIENALFRLNLTTLTTNCLPAPSSNSIYTGQTGVQTDEFGGIYFENGRLMGYQVDRGRNFEINRSNGALTLVSSNYPIDFRGDNAICRDCGDPTTNPSNTAEVTVCPDTTTTYTVTVTNEYGCKSTKGVTVVVHPLPTPMINGDNSICLGSSATLTVVGNGTYLWSTGETSATIAVSPTSTSTYQVTLTDENGCKGSMSHTVTVHPLPIAIVFGINEVCLGSSTTLFATGGTSYVWSNGETTSSITISPSATTEYSVTVTDGHGCQATAAYTVTVHPLPTANIAGDNEICLGGHTTLTATGGTSYVWNNGETTNWITISPSATTEYSVTVTDGNGCQATAAYTVTVHPLPTANIAGDNEICLGGHTTLTATGGTSYVWSNGETTNWITVSPSVTTEYSVTVTDGHGCEATATYTVTVHPLPTANIAGDNEICLGGHTTLTATGGTSYVWSNGETTNWITISPSVTTEYSVTVTDGNGCQATAAYTVTVHPLPTATIAGDNEICLGGHTTLTATGGTSYLWSNGETTNWITVSPSATTEYSVTVTDGNGCQATAAYTVTVHPLPTVTIAGDNEICLGGHTTLTATGGTSYVWSNGKTTNWITVSPSATTEYSVTVTDSNGCQATAAYTVTVHPLPTATIAGDNEICLGGHTTLTATGGTSYLWSNGETTNWITVSPSATTEYSVTVTDSNGCQATAAYTVAVHPLPTANIAGDNEICLGGHTTLTATGGTSYIWSNGETTTSITVSPGATTEYSVTVTDGNGCQATAAYTVTVHPLPTANIAGSDKVCNGTSLTLTATGGQTYLWSNGLTTSTITVTPNINTNYIVTVSNANNCTSTASITVMVKPKPEIVLTGPNKICSGSNTFIVVNGQSNNECPGVCDVDQPTVLVFWDLEACHSVMNLGTHMDYSEFVPVINKQNCTNVIAGNVHRLNQYKHSCTPGHDGNIGMCIGTQRYCNPSKLDYGQALRFEVTINPGQTGQITGLSFYEQSPLNYQFVNGASGLNDYATKYLIRVSKGGKYIFYRDEIATNRSWGLEQFDFSNNPLFKSNAAATYLFELIPYCPINNGANESIWDIDDIKVLGGCCNSNTPEVMTYLWSNGQTASSIIVNPYSNTTYTVTVTDCCGCTNVESHTVKVSSINANLGDDRMINLGQSVTLTPQITGQGVCDASNPSANTIQYLWNTGQTTSSIVVTPFESTFYRVTVTDCFECTDTESVTIHINMNTPMVMFPNPSNGTINIVSDSDLESNTSIRLYAVNGTIVIDNNVEITKHSQRKISANLSSNLPNGVYILEFKNGDQVFREKLIIHNK